MLALPALDATIHCSSSSMLFCMTCSLKNHKGRTESTALHVLGLGFAGVDPSVRAPVYWPWCLAAYAAGDLAGAADSYLRAGEASWSPLPVQPNFSCARMMARRAPRGPPRVQLSDSNDYAEQEHRTCILPGRIPSPKLVTTVVTLLTFDMAD
jgi:hypothetical protein